MLTTTTYLQFFRSYYKKNWQDDRPTTTYITLHVTMTSSQSKLQKGYATNINGIMFTSSSTTNKKT